VSGNSLAFNLFRTDFPLLQIIGAVIYLAVFRVERLIHVTGKWETPFPPCSHVQ
jgi:hypothetical protein